ncbi:MAG: tRNA-dihydrouridine synthase [Candidatus Komeilibacteria bacterium]|nr:tRNA-dihydrouridine synthase [Candidatus Komeilibacteria bacterium]
MTTNFWQNLPKPFFMLAPMADVTDAVFRRLIAKYGKPDVLYTEFVSVDGLCSAGRENLLIDLKYTDAERPIVAQIFGSKPENFKIAAELCVTLGFDGIDINMGCPDKNIQKQCAGAALIKHPQLAKEIIQATKEGAADLPVSVKTRIGDRTNELETWLPNLLETKPSAIIIHARTRQEMSKVPAKWETVKQAVEIAKDSGVLIVGNGDVKDLTDARQKAAASGADGIMLGRAIFGNPWLFSPDKKVTLTEKLNVMIEHTKLFETLLAPHKNFAIMKKHYKAYVNGFDGAKELRVRLMQTTSAAEVEEITTDWLNKNVIS